MIPAFKEWAIVCDALATGRQSVLIRKGGIAEGREGFSFKHREFALFPTWFHEQIARTRLPANTPLPLPPEGFVEVALMAVVEWSGLIADKSKLAALRELHILSDEVIEERFAYDEPPGVHVAFVRVFRLEPPLCLAMEKRYGGCRSWVEIPWAENTALVSVLPDEEHQARLTKFREILGC